MRVLAYRIQYGEYQGYEGKESGKADEFALEIILPTPAHCITTGRQDRVKRRQPNQTRYW